MLEICISSIFRYVYCIILTQVAVYRNVFLLAMAIALSSITVSHRDPVYPQRQATMWPSQGAIPVEMEYSTYPHPPPFTSPPATPMTPMTPVTPHHTIFQVPVPMPQLQYEQPLPAAYPRYVNDFLLFCSAV